MTPGAAGAAGQRDSDQYVAPDRAPGIDHARIVVSSAAPLLIDLHIDLGYTKKLMQFRMIVDKQDQGRALIINNLLKDSNSELRMTLELHRPGGRHLHACASKRCRPAAIPFPSAG